MERCSTCSRISLGLETGAGSALDGSSVPTGDNCGALNGSGGRPMVRQVEEGLLASPQLQIDVDPLADMRKNRHAYLHSVSIWASVGKTTLRHFY